MFAHSAVGPVNLSILEPVLGQEGEAARLVQALDRARPGLVVVDRSIEGLARLADGKARDPILRGSVDALAGVADAPPLAPYRQLLAWTEAQGVELRPIGPARPGPLDRWRLRRVAGTAEGPNEAAVARAAHRALTGHPTLGEVVKARETSLADALEHVLEAEPPRPVAVMAYPWGEAVSALLRRRTGLKRVEGQATGSWPA